MRTPSRDFGGGAAWLAALVFLYVWVSLSPFRDLSSTTPALTADLQSNILNQLISVVAFAAMMAFGLRKDLRPMLMQPIWLIAALMLWMAFATALGPAGIAGVRRVVMATMLIGMASIFILLPRDEKQFAGILMACAAVVIGLCYFGVIFLPRLSIHQPDDALEPQLAGDWRGYFDHKNYAAPCMALLAFAGLYIAKVRSRAAGWTIFVLAAFFVFQSGGKTATALLPATLVLAWLIERGNLFWRAIIALGVVGGYSALTLGATMSPALSDWLDSLGIDSTFTGRTDIWELAINGVQSNPLVGYGYDGYWGTEALVFGFREQATWAVVAPTAHNAYVEILLVGGVVALALLLIWIVVLPLRDLSRTIDRSGATALTRLYTRIWLFCLIQGGMESIFLSTNGAEWFLMMIAIFGLRHESHAYRRIPSGEGARPSRGTLFPA